MRKILCLLLSFLCGSCSGIALAQATPRQIDEFISKSTMEQRPPTAIEESFRQHKFESTITLANAVLEAVSNVSESPQYNNYLRSQAYLYRGVSQYALKRDWSLAIPDVNKSASLGNLEATRLLMELFLKYKTDQTALNGYVPSGPEIREAFITAADLTDSFALSNLTTDKVDFQVPIAQKLYWKMLYNLEPSDRGDEISELLKLTEGPAAPAAVDAINVYALVGGPFEGSHGLPGRDVFATMLAEHDLRAGLARSLGAHTPVGRTTIPESPTVLENFLAVSTFTGDTGFANMYLLVPGNDEVRDKNIRLMARDKIIQEIRPSDFLWIGCGPFSHNVRIFSIDREHDSISFLDPNYEFWTPSHNSCISNLSFKPFKYGFSMPTVSLKEVTPMIQAVGTFRSAEVLGQDRPGPLEPPTPLPKQAEIATCRVGSNGNEGFVGRSRTDLLKNDFMSFFNLVKIKDSKNSGGDTEVLYVPSASRFFGKVSLIVTYNSRDCIESISISLRRSFIDNDGTAMFASDIFRSFLAGALSQSTAGASSKGQAKTDDSEPKSILQEAQSLYAGKKSSFTGTTGGKQLQMENVYSPSGADILRITIHS